jgi:hypothetical protein
MMFMVVETFRNQDGKMKRVRPARSKVKRPPPLDGLRDSKSPIPPEWSHHRAILSAKCCAGKGEQIETSVFPFSVLKRQQPLVRQHGRFCIHVKAARYE